MCSWTSPAVGAIMARTDVNSGAGDILQTPISHTVTQTALRAGPGPAGSVLRCNQVDAHILDGELLDLLRLQLGQVCAFLPLGFVERYKPELTALFDFLLFRFTIFRDEPTPGMNLQNLRYVDAARSLVARSSGHAGPPPSAKQRLCLLGLLYVVGWGERGEGDPRRTAHWVLQKGEAVLRLAWVVNFLVFLRCGRYPTLLEHVMGMQLVYMNAMTSVSRSVNFQFLNRQMLWQQFTQLALCTVPMVDWDVLRRSVSGLIRQRRILARDTELGTDVEDLSCSVCKEPEAHTPYVTECNHVFCYYCLKTACMQDDQYPCPRCGVVFASSRRWAPPR